MKKNKYKILVVVLVFYQIFCMIHIPLKLIPDNQKDVQISSTVHHAHYMQNNQNPDGEQKVCDTAYFICESITIFEIAKFIFENTKAHVYIWQLPRANIGSIMNLIEQTFCAAERQ